MPAVSDKKRKALTRSGAAIGAHKQAFNKVADLRRMIWKKGATADPLAIMTGLDEVAELLVVVDEDLQIMRDNIRDI